MLALLGQSVLLLMAKGRYRFSLSRVEHLLECIQKTVLQRITVSHRAIGASQIVYIPVSPASPEYAIRVCLFNCLVLSSEALRIVAPLMAALEAATRVKSLPVNPSRTSLKEVTISIFLYKQIIDFTFWFVLVGGKGDIGSV